mgnify:CR=1 FL=1
MLFREIKSFVSSNFIFFRIDHCPRACNKVADAIALYGSKMVHAPPTVWSGDVPIFAQFLVAGDRVGQAV